MPMIKEKITNTLKKKIVILDGATGTELQKKGMPTGVCPETWCLENPEILESIHSSYAQVGAQIVYTCTFGANRFKLEQYQAQDDVETINKNLARLARRACGKNVLIAGDIGPTGLFVEPFGDLPFDEAIDAFKEQARGLIAGGCDLIVIETMIDIQEARAALIAVKELKNIFTIVSMTYEEDSRTLGGTDAVSALITLQSLGADAVGCNCSTGPEKMMELISSMKPYAKVPLLAKPNAGIPRLEGMKTVFDMQAKEFAVGQPQTCHSGSQPAGRMLRHYARTHKNTGQNNGKDKTKTAARKIPGRGKLGAWISTSRK